MIEFIEHSLNFTKVYVLITLLSVISLRRQKEVHTFLLVIFCINFFTELMNSILLFNDFAIGLSTTISVILHHGLWLWILGKSCSKEKAVSLALAVFVIFALANLFCMEGVKAFNFNTFLAGAFLYLSFFLYESFNRLKMEDFSFFTSTDYLLLVSPVFFFFGLSFVFAFKSKLLAYTIVFGNISLYIFIVHFANIVYYTLVNMYVFREKRLKNG